MRINQKSKQLENMQRMGNIPQCLCVYVCRSPRRTRRTRPHMGPHYTLFVFHTFARDARARGIKTFTALSRVQKNITHARFASISSRFRFSFQMHTAPHAHLKWMSSRRPEKYTRNLTRVWLRSPNSHPTSPLTPVLIRHMPRS